MTDLKPKRLTVGTVDSMPYSTIDIRETVAFYQSHVISQLQLVRCEMDIHS